jgi:hypothetical protein
VIHKVYSPTCSGRHGGDRWGVRMEQSRAVGRWMEDGAVDGRESGGWRRSGVGVVRVVSLVHSAHSIYLILSRIATALATKRSRNT